MVTIGGKTMARKNDEMDEVGFKIVPASAVRHVYSGM